MKFTEGIQEQLAELRAEVGQSGFKIVPGEEGETISCWIDLIV